jgi:hypothetical protein
MAKAVAVNDDDLTPAKERRVTASRQRGEVPSAELIPMQFRMSPEFVREFKIEAANRGMRDRPKPGGAIGHPGRRNRECGMKWRVVLELVGPDGTVVVHEVCGRAAVGEYVPRMIGLTLAEGKHLLAALQVHLVQAQAEGVTRSGKPDPASSYRILTSPFS